jgi:translation initiation factor IF-3
VNEAIHSPSVRVVGAEGEMLGVMTVAQAMAQAEAVGLDLVEISPNAEPPVCKILDYGKYKYQAQKKANEARKKQKVIEVKEIKMRPGIDQHDYEVKLRAIHKFLDEGDKVKVTIRFRGREFLHQELGLAVLNRVREEMEEKAKVEAIPKMEGRQMIMVIAPK